MILSLYLASLPCWSSGVVLTTPGLLLPGVVNETPPDQQGSEARYRLRITISAYSTCIRRPREGGSRRNIAMPLGTKKLEWFGYPTVKKIQRYVYSF